MALVAGSQFGSYEIAESVGSGGMGEVYRATDRALKRDVAIKVLPESFTGDADRLARFQLEAEVLASLNHLNIAQIYGLERNGPTMALVMELIEGPTLAERLEQGPIAPDRAIEIALQIADALEAAHERGIVHRDLKPANVKLRPDGTVKVLDFGVAKTTEPAAAASGTPVPALTTPAMTAAGVILGTAAYMSPEQARGRVVDRRTDIWAFGCVLYEMLTGQPAFGGEDITVTLARVLERGPDMQALPPATPPAVRRTLELCLQKERRDRIRDIGDVKLALRGRNPKNPTDWTEDGYVVYTEISTETGADLKYLRLGDDAQADGEPVTFRADRFDTSFGAVSPDGRWIAYLSNETGSYEIWMQSFPTGPGRWRVSETRLGAGTTQQSRWSRDGTELYFDTGAGGQATVMAASLKSPPVEDQAPLDHPHPLFSARINGFAPSLGTMFFDVSRDGERFLVSAVDAAGGEPALHVVVDWQEIFADGRR